MLFKDFALFGHTAFSTVVQRCISLHIPNGHVCGSQRFEELQPLSILIGITTMATSPSLHGLNQPNTFVIAERMAVMPHRAAITR